MKMTMIIACVVSSITFLSASAFADEYVSGYTRSDGTYVAPYYRTSPNSSRSDNYSSRDNTNPYTGKQGDQRNEYSDPPVYNQPYSSPWRYNK